MRSWLRNAFSPVRSDMAFACLFGSVLNPAVVPRDVDLLLVAVDGAGQPSWRRLRMQRDLVAPSFLIRFGLPLSAKVLTPSEWSELDEGFFREREALVPY